MGKLVIRNARDIGRFTVNYVNAGCDIKMFRGTFEECVIFLILESPVLREELKGIQFDKLKEILEGVK